MTDQSRAAVRIRADYDAAVKRYRAKCPRCPYVAFRAKREGAIHALSLHVIHQHNANDVEVVL